MYKTEFSKALSRGVITCLLISLCIFSGVVASVAQEKTAQITFYSNMEKTVSLDPVPYELSWYLPVKGTTVMKSLILEIKKEAGYVKTVFVPLAEDGSFDYACLLKGGPGNYTVTVFGSTYRESLDFSGICFYSVAVKEKIPDAFAAIYLNDRVIDFVNSSMGKKVGRGECWDLAQEALDINGADWDRPLRFGIQLDPLKDEIRPGDIIQFYSVVLTEKLPDGRTMWETLGMPDHTAVIYRVIEKLHYELAHQNSGNKRYVIKSEVDLSKKTSGAYYIYRPVAQLVKAGELNP